MPRNAKSRSWIIYNCTYSLYLAIFWSDFFFVTLLKGRPEMAFVKFIYSEKATKVCEISTLDLSYVATVESFVEISQNFVVFSEYMNIMNNH